MALAASLQCRVVSTRWPVRAASVAVLAVSMSRVSPTSSTSGSWRMKARRAVLKSRPLSRFTWVWVMPRRVYSIGSSTVEMLMPGSLRSESRA